jgi:PKD repeat protein
MKHHFLILFFVIAVLNPMTGQVFREPGGHLPKPTAKGEEKIDTRIDNMGYWRRMADSGFVFLAPMESIPAAFFTGSRIEHPMVMTTNSPDVPTTIENSTQSENSVFVDPTNDQLLLNSNNSTENPVGSLYGANYLLSDDAGQTWDGSVNGAGGSNSGDPATAISLTGRQYIGYINNSGGQSVSYSADGGNTWTPVVAGPTPPSSILDKNHMWIDNSPTSPHAGNLYNAWTPFSGSNVYQIEIVRSTDQGLSWSSALNISSAVNAGSHNQGVNIQTGPDGEVYVVWAIYDSWPTDETAMGFARSTNGGVSYDPATRIISNIRGIRTTETSKNQRVNSFPSMAVDISDGPYSGNIYIVWSNIGVPGINTGSDIDVYMIRSEDEGATWSTPVRVNQDPGGLGKEHYFPWITCDPVTGDLSVIFYDDRNVSSTQCEVFVAFSFDAGNTWDDFKVSDVAFTPAPIPGLAGGYMGDYLGIAARGGWVYPVWSDNRTGTVMSYVSPFEHSPLPYANFQASNTTPCLDETITLTDLTSRDPASWDWSITPGSFTFMNGTNSSSQNPELKFTALGDYTIQLIATNSFGADTLVRSNYISVSDVNADFAADVTQVVVNNNVTFTDQSSCNVLIYSWDFGVDATPATANTAGPHVVTYSSAGFKTISLTVNGITTTTKTDYIEVAPEIFNMTNGTITTCSGTFYDSQGTNNYLNNEDYTLTFFPGQSNKLIQVVFTLFDLESHSSCIYDYLMIYDGENTSAPLIGTYCGTNSPGTVVATNSSGALTFRFHSDESVTRQGWVATLSCETPPPPSYCSAGATTCDEYISRVVMGIIDNSTSCTSGGYHDYTAFSTKVSPGFSYPVNITNGNPVYSDDQCGIWIDWNQDYDFDDPGETITVSGTPGVGPYTANIIPPGDALKGPTRMRVRIMWTGTLSPCGTATYGEVEDYTIYVGTHGLWEGGTPGSENDWNTANNWDDGIVPTASTNVLIPEEATHYPSVSGPFSCLDMEIKDGATVTVEAGAVMNILGDLTVGQGSSGRLVVDGGTCNVSGTTFAGPGSKIDIINGGVMNDND